MSQPTDRRPPGQRQRRPLSVENERLRQMIGDLLDTFANEALSKPQWTLFQEAKRLIGRT